MTETAKRPSLKELLTDIFTDRRLALMLALGYSAGLPLRLVFSTQSA
jgi:PAT family beta-lactamase induction signal transducer AmpG